MLSHFLSIFLSFAFCFNEAWVVNQQHPVCFPLEVPSMPSPCYSSVSISLTLNLWRPIHYLWIPHEGCSSCATNRPSLCMSYPGPAYLEELFDDKRSDASVQDNGEGPSCGCATLPEARKVTKARQHNFERNYGLRCRNFNRNVTVCVIWKILTIFCFSLHGHSTQKISFTF